MKNTTSNTNETDNPLKDLVNGLLGDLIKQLDSEVPPDFRKKVYAGIKESVERFKTAEDIRKVYMISQGIYLCELMEEEDRVKRRKESIALIEAEYTIFKSLEAEARAKIFKKKHLRNPDAKLLMTHILEGLNETLKAEMLWQEKKEKENKKDSKTDSETNKHSETQSK